MKKEFQNFTNYDVQVVLKDAEDLRKTAEDLIKKGEDSFTVTEARFWANVVIDNAVTHLLMNNSVDRMYHYANMLISKEQNKEIHHYYVYDKALNYISIAWDFNDAVESVLPYKGGCIMARFNDGTLEEVFRNTK